MNIRIAGVALTVVAAVGVAGCGSSSSSSSAPPATTAATTAPATTAPATTAPATTTTAAGAAAKNLFVNGDAASGAPSCASCHALAAAGSTSTIGPDLDALAPDDKTAEITEMIAKPNSEIVEGYQKNVMPQNYSSTLGAAKIAALAAWINTVSAHSGD